MSDPIYRNEAAQKGLPLNSLEWQLPGPGVSESAFKAQFEAGWVAREDRLKTQQAEGRA